MGLSVIQVLVGGFDKNFSYVVFDVESKDAVIVDPSGDLDKVLEVVDENELNITGALITHTHQDHIDKLGKLLGKYSVPTYMHENGVGKIVINSTICKMRDRETLTLGGNQLTVMYTPGHAEDAVCFCIDTENADDDIPKVITGDTLFVEGCGITDKNGVQSLFNSLIRLRALPENAIVYSGHDYGSKPQSTILWEKENNKYLLATDFDEFKELRLS